jgi:hypothetical protein
LRGSLLLSCLGVGCGLQSDPGESSQQQQEHPRDYQSMRQRRLRGRIAPFIEQTSDAAFQMVVTRHHGEISFQIRHRVTHLGDR